MNMEFRSKMQTKMILIPLPTSVLSHIRELALEASTQLGKIQNWQSGYFGNYIKKLYFFENFCSMPIIQYPAYYNSSLLFDLNYKLNSWIF